MQVQVPFQQVDVFTDTPFKGNPVAVVLDGNDLSSEEMQDIAHWTNLSETTFVCTPTNPLADYKLRIFTPNHELPFAGHPTLGSAFAIRKSGVIPKQSGYFVQESEIGLVNVHLGGERLFFTLPESTIKPINGEELDEIADALGILRESVRASLTIDVGAVWMTLQLADAEVVRNLSPHMEKLVSLTPTGVTGVTVFGKSLEDSDSQFEVRSFAPAEGVPEDPVCGSGNGCVGTMVQQLQLTDDSSYVTSQGRSVGRDGKVEVQFQEDGSIRVGGHAVTCIEGHLTIKES